MTKPLGYYTNYTPGDGGLLGDMEEAWEGSFFRKLNNTERLWMVVKIAENLCASLEDQVISSTVEEAVERIEYDQLSIGDQFGLILALIDQVQHYRERSE